MSSCLTEDGRWTHVNLPLGLEVYSSVEVDCGIKVVTLSVRLSIDWT